jgi:hypothetical protein
VKTFLVYGHAFVPMKVQIKIEADPPEAAMKAANKKLKTKIRDYLIPGSEDDGAAFGFDATDAEEVKGQR